MTVTAAVLLAATVGLLGEPGIASGRSRGASSRTVTDLPTGSTRTPTSMPGYFEPASARREVVADRGLDGRLLLGQAGGVDAVGVDVGGAQVGAVQRRTVREVVEPLALEVGADASITTTIAISRMLAKPMISSVTCPLSASGRTSAPGHRSASSAGCALDVLPDRDRVARVEGEAAAPAPRMAGKNGRSTPESTRTVMTAVPTWQLPPAPRT